MKVSKGKISNIWKCFKQLELQISNVFTPTSTVACEKCYFFVKNYSPANGTTSLSRHQKSCSPSTSIEGFCEPIKATIPAEGVEAFRDCLAKFITSTFSSLKLVEDPAFIALIQKAISFGATYSNISVKQLLPGRKGLRTHIAKLFEKTESGIIERLKNAQSIAFSTDMWSTKSNHYIDISFTSINDFKMENGQFQMISFDEKSATGLNILEDLKTAFDKIDLNTNDLCITTDSGSNILKACKDGQMKNIRCICHRFNTIISDAWKIAKSNDTFSKLDSDISSLIEYVNRIGIQGKLPIKLQSGCPTRPWRMLGDRTKTVLLSYDALTVELEKIGQLMRISQIDKLFLTKVNTILEIFTEVFDELERIREPTLNKVLPMIGTVIDSLNEHIDIMDDSLGQQAVNDFATALKQQIELKVVTSVQDIHYAASFLDPAFKTFNFHDDPEQSIEKACEYILQMNPVNSETVEEIVILSKL